MFYVWSRGFTQTHLFGFVFMGPEDVRSVSLGAIWNFSKGTGLPWQGHLVMGNKGLVQKAYVHQDRKDSNQFTVLFYTIQWLLRNNQIKNICRPATADRHGHAAAQAVGRLLLVSEARQVHVQFVVDEMALFIAKYFSFPLSVSFHHCSILIHSSTTHSV
jgi:hypothetical protein